MDRGGLEFLGRLGVSVAVLGSALALATISTSTALAILSGNGAVSEDLSVRNKLEDHTDLFTPVETRIKQREQLIAQLKDPNAVETERRKLAPLYNELGKKSFDLGQFARAEESYQRSLAADPKNPTTLSNLAGLYASAAVRQSESRQRLTLFRNASDYFQSARTVENNPSRKRQYETHAASSLFSAANELKRSGMNSEAIRELQRARALVTSDSPLALQIDQMLQIIGGR